jgi:Flp pilus assembly protein TadD
MRPTSTKAKATAPTVSGGGMAQPGLPLWLMAGLLVLGTAALYWPATGCGFVNFDDDLYVTGNIHVQAGLTWDGIKWACLHLVASNWHPLTMWSAMLDCQLYGLKPWGHHLTSVLLHALNAGLVFVLLQRMTGAAWRSLWVAAVFAVHPLHVESVAWVSERKDVLSGFFGLLALMAYARYAEMRARKAAFGVQKPARPKTLSWAGIVTCPGTCYLLSLLSFTLGLMSKPMLVSLPFVMLLLDYWPLGRLEPSPRNSQLLTTLRLVREKIPFFALAVAASVVTYLVQRQGGAVAAVAGLPLGARVSNALISYGRYLGAVFWPTGLAAYYPHPGHWPLGKALMAGGMLLAVSVLFLTQRRRAPSLLVGWLWFLGTLVPVIGLVQVGQQAMADRYAYLPSVGVLILGVWGACELSGRRPYWMRAWALAGGATLALCAALTRQQIGYWRDSEALWRHALAVTEDNYFAHDSLGIVLAKAGRTGEAIREYEAALRLKPDYGYAHNNLGSALEEKGQSEEAIRQYQEAIALEPANALAHNNLGTALDKKGQSDDAIRQLLEAIRLQPDYAEAHNNLGAALDRKGQSVEALREYQEAVRLNPGYADAHNNLGAALDDAGRSDEAIRHYEEALRLKPDHAEAHNNLGIALGRKGEVQEAIRHFEEAVRLNPGYAEAHNNLGIALGRQGRNGEAAGHFREALRLRPDYADARRNLDAVLAASGRSLAAPGGATNP